MANARRKCVSHVFVIDFLEQARVTSKQICVKRRRDSVAFKGGRHAERLGRFVFLLLIQVPSLAELQLRTGGDAIKTSGVMSQGCSRFLLPSTPQKFGSSQRLGSELPKFGLAFWMVRFSETLKGDKHDEILELCDATVESARSM